VILALSTASCTEERRGGQLTFSSAQFSFAGAVAADEPQAAAVAREVLFDGGTAADAAIALYFALAVTYPSSASLGGGGMCVVRSAQTGETSALDFLPGRAADTEAARRPTAIPANVRGMFALYSRFGRLRWETLVARAETLARQGITVSRALAHDLQAVSGDLLADPAARAIFGGRDGRVLGEGDRLVQQNLADTLAAIRSRGPMDVYTGKAANQLAAAAREAGSTLSAADLAGFAPTWPEPVTVSFDELTLHTAPPPARGGIIAAAIWAALDDDGRYLETSPDERAHLFIETAMRAYANAPGLVEETSDDGPVIGYERLRALIADYDPDRHTALSGPGSVENVENPASTSFVVADRLGSAVACTVTLNNLFGNGRVAPGTGIVLAAPPSEYPEPMGIVPMLLDEEGTGRLYLAVAASGGVVAPMAAMRTVLLAAYEQRPLDQAVAAPRLYRGASPDVVLYEPGLDEETIAALERRGHQLVEVPELGRVNIIYCPSGLAEGLSGCNARSDQRGFGLGMSF